MKNLLIKMKGFPGGALALAFAVLASPAFAQDNVVALGRVNTLGTMLNSSNTVNGVVSSFDSDVGDYVITVSEVGAFAGTDVNDYVVEVSLSSTASGDETIKAWVTSVTDDILTVAVHTDEVEDDTNVNGPEARDQNFYFVIYRVPDMTPAATSTRYLLSTGVVNANGSLASGVGVDDVAIATLKNGGNDGDYRITLSKTGAFAGDNGNDYILSLSTHGANNQDQVIRGGVQSVASDDEVVFNVHTDDVQSGSNDNLTDPADNKFFFTIYRITAGSATNLPGSKLLVALARVSSAGSLLTTPNSFDGGALSSIRNSEGDYRVTISSPGAFAGKSEDDFVPQVFLNQNFSTDEMVNTDVTVADDDTLHIDVNTSDLEQDGEPQGVLQDAGFFLTLKDAVGGFQPDMLISKKRAASSMKGDNRYNTSGGGQQVVCKLPGTVSRKFHFLLENDGSLTDRVRLKEVRSSSRLKTKYFRRSGGRKNISAKVRTGGHIEENLRPDKTVRFEGQVNYKSPLVRPGKTFRLRAKSIRDTSAQDVNRVKVKPI